VEGACEKVGIPVGGSLGEADGLELGAFDSVGATEGFPDRAKEGGMLGTSDGIGEGAEVGVATVGFKLGKAEGIRLGASEGISLELGDGPWLGAKLGQLEGACGMVGTPVGTSLGEADGLELGALDSVGATEGFPDGTREGEVLGNSDGIDEGAKVGRLDGVGEGAADGG
jgi:hypothetical protein